MSKFTKGPWTARATGQHWNNPALENIEINYGVDQECVCDTVYEMADANLISAAPDMYEALQSLRGHMAFLKGDDYELVVKADKALAKADGKGE